MSSSIMTYGGEPDCTTRNLVIGVVVLCLLSLYWNPVPEYMSIDETPFKGLNWGQKKADAKRMMHAKLASL